MSAPCTLALHSPPPRVGAARKAPHRRSMRKLSEESLFATVKRQAGAGAAHGAKRQRLVQATQ